jgi:hypothetical protein
MTITLIPYLTPAVAGGNLATFGTPFMLANDIGRNPISTGNPWENGVAGNCREGYLPTQRRAVQGVEYFRAIYKGNIGRNQLENSLKFTVQREFVSLDFCLGFLQSHAGYVPKEGCLMVTLTGFGTAYLPNAILVDISTVKHFGGTCDVSYSLLGSYRPDRGTGGPWQTTQA